MTAQSGVYAQTSNESTAFTFRAEDGDKRFIFYSDKDINSMFSKILAHLPKYTVSSSKKCIFIFTGTRTSKLIKWTDGMPLP